MQAIKVNSYPSHVPDDLFHEGLEQVKRDAVAGFEANGEIQPSVVIMTEETSDVILWSEGAIPYGFLHFAYRGKARAYYAMFESWYVEGKTKDVEHIGHPSQHLDRKEALMVIGESRDGWCEMAAWDIIRNGAGVHLVRSEMGAEQTDSLLAEVLWK